MNLTWWIVAGFSAIFILGLMIGFRLGKGLSRAVLGHKIASGSAYLKVDGKWYPCEPLVGEVMKEIGIDPTAMEGMAGARAHVTHKRERGNDEAIEFLRKMAEDQANHKEESIQ